MTANIINMKNLSRHLVALALLFTLANCSDPCDDVNCLNGGTCDDGTCLCPDGYLGVNCEITPCDQIDCLNGGTCDDGTCLCPDGYLGANCEITPCDQIDCLNGADCEEGVCICAEGYTGTNCESEIREPFLGTWESTYYCDIDPTDIIQLTIPITADPDSILNIVMLIDGADVTGTVVDEEGNFAIQNQEILSGTDTFKVEGGGQLVTANLTFTMKIYDPTDPDLKFNCFFDLVR